MSIDRVYAVMNSDTKEFMSMIEFNGGANTKINWLKEPSVNSLHVKPEDAEMMEGWFLQFDEAIHGIKVMLVHLDVSDLSEDLQKHFGK